MKLIVDYFIRYDIILRMKDEILFLRKIDFFKLLQKGSFFLLGPRSTGKSFWIKKSIKRDVLYINLLKSAEFLKLQENPGLLEDMLASENYKLCVIDEIQKIPQLLDEVHRLIEDRNINFMLTSSSVRKLKRTHANMLGGRASLISFQPLTFFEIEKFDLKKYLLFGGLPKVYKSNHPENLLQDYIQTYLEEEIKLESNLRSLAPFQRFLKVAALNSGEMIQFSNISSDSGVPMTTVKEYFQILEDTLVGYVLNPWTESIKRKAIQTAKFYFFDTGVQNALINVNTLDLESDRWGKLFECFILNELRSYISYNQKYKKIYYWRSVNKQEVDFIVGDEIAIEVKTTKKITPKMLSGLKALQEENKIKEYLIISNDPISRKTDGIHIIPWEKFLKNLWSEKYF